MASADGQPAGGAMQKVCTKERVLGIPASKPGHPAPGLLHGEPLTYHCTSHCVEGEKHTSKVSPCQQIVSPAVRCACILKCLLRFSLTVVGASLLLKHYKMKQRTFPKPSGWKKDPTPSLRVTCLTPHRILEMFLRLKEMNRRNEALDCVPLSTDVERPAPPACPATGATAESHCGCDRPKPRRAWQLCRRARPSGAEAFPARVGAALQ